MNRKIGILGEKLAIKYLRQRGYIILDHNYRTKFGELDIIAQLEDVICFIEVKTRTTEMFGLPGEAVNLKKQLKIKKLAQYYIANLRMGRRDISYRFDVIEVKILGKKYKINHINDAFD